MEAAKEATYLNARLMAYELAELGITVDCAPVLDVPVVGADPIIGDRAYGDSVAMITVLAAEVCRGLMDGGVLPVIKHIPGHGRAPADSHLELPVVDASLEELRAVDFAAFTPFADMSYAMTAHVVYTALDADNPATTSRVVLDVVREELGFKGILLSDDLTMKALSGSYAQRVERSMAAGCDVVLLCNAAMDVRREVAEAAPVVNERVTVAMEKHRAIVGSAKALGFAEANARVEALLGQVAA